MHHQPFCFQTADELAAALSSLGSELTPAADTALLRTPVCPSALPLANRFAFQAMEGCDGEADGRPSETTRRRYRRFAASGAGFLYVEATAVQPNGRANPRQLMITGQTAPAFAEMAAEMRRIANEAGHPEPCLALQLTHSGRYSKSPEGKPAPLVAWPDLARDPAGVLPTVITDEELDALPEAFVRAAALAKEAGFSCVDIKCCHGYLLNELTGARLRPGRYGGSFENRVRLLLQTVRRVKEEVGIPVMVRLNVHDEYPLPYGFGVSAEDYRRPDLTEPMQLVDKLIEAGVWLIDCTAGNPYFNPHVNRPFDSGPYRPPVSQLEQTLKHWQCVRELKAHNGGAVYMASMFSWLRHLAPEMAAAAIAAGWFDVAGFGRQSFAYPTFPAEWLQTGRMDPAKCCVCCSKCTDLMRTGHGTGCVVRDPHYAALYRSIPVEARPKPSAAPGEHV